MTISSRLKCFFLVFFPHLANRTGFNSWFYFIRHYVWQETLIVQLPNKTISLHISSKPFPRYSCKNSLTGSEIEVPESKVSEKKNQLLLRSFIGSRFTLIFHKLTQQVKKISWFNSFLTWIVDNDHLHSKDISTQSCIWLCFFFVLLLFSTQ